MQASRAVEDALRAVADPARAEGEKKYLKSELEHIGCAVPVIRKTVKAHLKTHQPDAEARWKLVQVLWARPVHELRFAAVTVLAQSGADLSPALIPMLEDMIRQAKTWALVDPLATDVMGALADREDLGDTLDRWAADPDFWIRRSAMLCLLRPLRAGGGDWARFTRYADAMLDEKEFFIRKAIGWVLRDTGRKRPELVDAFIAPRTDRASGVTMREAVKVLDADRAAELMAAYKAKRVASAKP